MKIQYDNNGDGWEIGALYEFSDDGVEWGKELLLSVSGGEGQYETLSNYWKRIRICQTPVVAGKKHKKPVELIEGEWYYWKSDGLEYCGKYVGVSGELRLAMIGGATHSLDYKGVSNIKRMVEAEDD